MGSLRLGEQSHIKMKLIIWSSTSHNSSKTFAVDMKGFLKQSLQGQEQYKTGKEEFTRG